MTLPPYIIAIDGPAGAGKSSISKGVADRLGIVRVDTGAIYRAVTLLALEHNLQDDAAITALVPSLSLRFDGETVLLAGRDISTAIRTPAVSAAVSRVSAIPAVRDGLLDLQRRLGRASDRGALLEGRDIGTVVFPDADVKIFLTASAEERARRRHKDLSQAGDPSSYEQVLSAIQARDHYDSNRPVAPLKPADDAIIVDSTGKTMEQVIEEICSLVDGALEPTLS